MIKITKPTLSVFLFLTVFVSSLALAKSASFKRCGAEATSTEDIQAVLFETNLMWADAAASTAVQTITIPVYFHRGRSGLTDESIEEQMEVLNEAYFDAGFSFKLMDILKGNGRRVGDESTLNVRFDVRRGLLGRATFPWKYRWNPDSDGVKIAAGSVPGGAIEEFNLGATLVHEVGHWMGLWHTFQGGCSAEGDEVEDTTPQRRPTSGCPASLKSSCRGVTEQVSFHNFMDYSDDICMTGFTKMQEFRMHEMFRAYRL